MTNKLQFNPGHSYSPGVCVEVPNASLLFLIKGTFLLCTRGHEPASCSTLALEDKSLKCFQNLTARLWPSALCTITPTQPCKPSRHEYFSKIAGHCGFLANANQAARNIVWGSCRFGIDHLSFGFALKQWLQPHRYRSFFK